MSADVVSFSQSESGIPAEHLKLDWYARVEQTAKMAGIPILEELLCKKDTPIREKDGSGNLRDLSANNKHVSLESFLKKVSMSGGGANTWERWEIDAKAASIAKSLSISTEFHPQEIISFYEDVSQYLGRRPADSQEFWHVLVLVTKNRSDFKIMSANSAVKELDTQVKGLSNDYTASLARINTLQSDLNYKTNVLGDIPEDFTVRFNNASELVGLYNDSSSRTTELENELALLGSKFAISETMINKHRNELFKLQSSENGSQSVELLQALNNVNLAKQFLLNLKASNAESGLTVEKQNRTISCLKTLNRRLTLLAKDKGQRVRHLEKAQELSRTLNRRLSGMARGFKIGEANTKFELKDQRRQRENLEKMVTRFRRMKAFGTTGIVLLASFSLALAFHITTL